MAIAKNVEYDLDPKATSCVSSWRLALRAGPNGHKTGIRLMSPKTQANASDVHLSNGKKRVQPQFYTYIPVEGAPDTNQIGSYL